MPISLNALKEATAETSIEFGGETAKVVYRPNVITPNSIDKMMESKEDQALVVQQLVEMLVAWEVTGADGEALPITEEVLGDMPINFLILIIQHVQSEMTPDPKAQSSFDAG